MMPGDLQVTPEQLAQERSLLFALLADLGVLALAVPVGLLGGSLTIKAEAIRFVLGMSIEIFAYTLAGSAGDYQRLDRVRSRRSGRVVFVEIVLSFEPGLTIAEVNCRIAALKHSWRMRSSTPTSRSWPPAPRPLEAADRLLDPDGGLFR